MQEFYDTKWRIRLWYKPVYVRIFLWLPAVVTLLLHCCVTPLYRKSIFIFAYRLCYRYLRKKTQRWRCLDLFLVMCNFSPPKLLCYSRFAIGFVNPCFFCNRRKHHFYIICIAFLFPVIFNHCPEKCYQFCHVMIKRKEISLLPYVLP